MGLGVLLAGCSAAGQAHVAQAPTTPQQSIFYGDYSEMKAGPENSEMLYYENPRARWMEYSKLIIDRVTFWRGLNGSNISIRQQQALCDYMQDVLRDHLSKEFIIVDRAGPGVMRLKITITDADGASNGVMTTANDASLPDPKRAVGELSTSTYEFAGLAQSEGEITNSVDDQRLLTWIDRRIGGGSAKAAQQWTWRDAHAAIDYWAETLAARLAQWHRDGDVAG